MAKAHVDWKVLSHGSFDKLEDNLWCIEGTVPAMPIERKMVVARLADGRLVLHNAIALDEKHLAELLSFGTPSLLVVPSAMHRLDAPAYKKRFPDIQVLCPAGAKRAVEQVVAVDQVMSKWAEAPSVTFESLQGVKDREGVMCVRSEGGRRTLVFNDLLMNNRRGKGLLWAIYAMMGSTGGPKTTWLARKWLVTDARALRQSFEQLADLPDLVRLIPAHGGIIDREPAQVLRAVAAAL